MEILLLLRLKVKKMWTKILAMMNILGDGEVYYIAGPETLPPPLSQEEEAEMLKKLLENDTNVRKILVERNLRLVVYIAKKFENTGVGIEDLISIGTIGLMKAINTFDARKNIKLATYASRCIENEILMHLRRNSKTKNEISIDEPLNTDGDWNELLLSDVLGTEEDDIFNDLNAEIDRELIKESMNKLSKREKVIMELRFGFESGKEKTQKDVADMLGISQSYISRLEKRIIHRMKREMSAKL